MKFSSALSVSLVCVGLLHGLLVNQANRWERSVRPSWRFVGVWLFGLYAAAIGSLFNQLPPNTVELLLSHLFEPLSALLLCVLAAFSLAMAGSLLAAAKLQRSL